jgi:hypothetical protein
MLCGPQFKRKKAFAGRKLLRAAVYEKKAFAGRGLQEKH